jgi:flagellar hook protein FlgE
MYSGISGMKNFQTKLDVIGNNIANVNTYGFKKGRATFQDLMNQTISGASRATENRGGQNAQQVGLGASLSTIDTIHTQGSLQTTGRALDVAVSGDGFFTVRNGNNEMYTRAGNFYLDSNGSLVTGQGNLVQGYGVNADGTVQNALGDIIIDSDATIPPQATGNVTFDGNLKASQPIATDTDGDGVFDDTDGDGVADGAIAIDFTVKDSLGQDIDLKVTLIKTAEKEWKYEVTDPSADPSATPPVLGVLDTSATPSSGALKFDEQGNLRLDPANPIKPITINPPNGAVQGQEVNLDFSNITQFDSSNSANVDTVDGNAEGSLESFNIGSSGEVNGVYSNGEVRVVSQLALATFSNPEGLTKAGNNLFQASNNSGLPNVGVAGEGRGSLQSGSLEMSNVDLSEEFTEMITAQRGFQANTRIITTSDEILQELVNLKR